MIKSYTVYPPEDNVFQDRVCGLSIRRLTGCKGHSQHPYFTGDGWFDNDRKILFIADRNVASDTGKSIKGYKYSGVDFDGPRVIAMHDGSFDWGSHHPPSPVYRQTPPDGSFEWGGHHPPLSVSRQTPPVSRQSPSVYRQSSPVSRQSSPVSRQSPPVSRQSSPVYRQSPPVSRQSSPVYRQSSPVYRQSSPVYRQYPRITREGKHVVYNSTTAGYCALPKLEVSI